MRDKKIVVALFVIFLLLIFGYIIFTARFIILGPRLFLNTKDGTIVVKTQVIEIAGMAKNTSELRMNNKKILLTPEGAFAEQLLLAIGKNTFEFDAKDKFGRTSKKTLIVIYKPKDDNVIQLTNTNINNSN